MARAQASPSAQSTATIGFNSRACGVSLTADKLRIIQPLLDRTHTNLHQSRTLATLRDPAVAGLPKLLSGELNVAESKEVGHHPNRQTV